MLEQQLAEHFRSVPIDAEDERRVQHAVLFATALPGPTRRRLIAATSGAIVLVLALAGMIALFATRHPDASPPASRPTPNPTHQLYTQTWTDRAAATTVVFRHGSATVSYGCSGATYALTITKQRLNVRVAPYDWPLCSLKATPPSVQTAAERTAANRLDHMLRSSPRWGIHGAILTLTHAGATIRLTDVVPVSHTTSVSPKPPATIEACAPHALTLTHATSMAGMYKYIDIFGLRNTGTVACTLSGYPRLAVSSAGIAVSEPIHYNRHMYGIRAVTVTLSPGESAGVDVGVFPSPNATTNCPIVQHPTISLTPPGTNRPLSTTRVVDLPICADGSEPIYVSPIHAGTRAP